MRAGLAVVVLAALALPASAQAHAFLESSTPANGTSLGRAPHVVSLHFTEPVSAGLAHVQLFDGRGRQRAGVRVRGGRTASELVVSLPALGTGAYRIAWSTVSQDDLHVTRGALVFGAGAAAPAIRASAGATPPTSLTESAAHLLDLVSLSILIAVCGLLAGPLPAAVRARVTRFGLAALPALLLAGIVALDDKASQLPLRDVLAHTAWGHAMVARELAVAAVAIALARAPATNRVRTARTRRRNGSRERTCRDAGRAGTGLHGTAHPRGRTLGGRADRAGGSSCPAPSDATSARRSPASAASPRPASAC